MTSFQQFSGLVLLDLETFMMSKPNWDSVRLYFSGDEYFSEVIQAIDQAQIEIIIESYLFDMDPIGLRVLGALIQAQERGVRVQILVDGVGSFNWILALRKFCRDNHLHFRIYHPIPLRLDFLKRISWKSLRRLLFLLKKINKRNHRKVILIDHQKAFLGSLNISQVHTEEFMGKFVWRDTGIQVTGQPLAGLRRACVKTWVRARLEGVLLSPLLMRKNHSKQRADEVLRLNSTIKWRYFLLRDLNRRMRTAQKRILITNAYFLPRRSILRSLIKAARKGVYVGLCLPSVTDVQAVRWASRSLYIRLIKAGVHIFEFQDRVLHAKTLIIDDNWATVGSHNLNHRSLNHDLEVEVVVNQTQWVDPLVKQWDDDIRQSHEIDLDELGRLTWLEQGFARLAYWFRYWL
jgi:cardiolipin synthase